MPRIFGYLAGANLILILATAGLGFCDPAPTADRHVLLAVMTLLLTCLVQVLAFTYLTVTGKVIAQAIHLGRLDAGPLEEAKSIKRSLTRTLGGLIVVVVAVTASGAAAWRAGDPHTYHLPAAVFFVGAFLWAFMREFDLLTRNSLLVQHTLDQYALAKKTGSERLPAGFR